MSGIIFGGLVIPDSSITPAKLSQPLTLATAVNSTSGTSIDFTGIPSWVDKITIMLSNVSTNGTSQPMFQIGDSGGIETTGYVTATSNITTVANVSTAYTNGWQIYSSAAARVVQGAFTLTLVNPATNTWVGSGSFTTDTPSVGWNNGIKSLSGTLDRVRITTAGGTDLFDAGVINILYQ
ncbi:MAG: hypothetical protein NTX97_00355 [Bacteroidetes bacterium]|jgi:hypothetical protein|nr:hypothetical protein [Bacteroidota bacterium]